MSSINFPFILSVPPKITSYPHETHLLNEGEKLTLGCKATGKPKPEVSWYKGHMELIQGLGSAEYYNQGVSRFDNGNYKCVARNNASEVEYTVQVIVRCKYSIWSHMCSVYIQFTIDSTSLHNSQSNFTSNIFCTIAVPTR
jgi:hypothetical protein